MQKRILLTGVTGFLGSHLAKALLAKGYDIVALKRKSSSLRRIELIASDIAFYDIEALDFSTPFRDHGRIDAVIHTATCYGRHNESVSEIFAANTEFPLRLLDAGSHADIGMFLNTDTIIDKYLNLYSLSKHQLLQWGKFFSMRGQIHFGNVRLEHFYGPDDDDTKFTTYVIKSCLDNIPELKLTPGEQRRDFIYIDDVVAAYLLLLEKQELLTDWFVEWDVGSGHSISIREFVKTVHRITASKTHLAFGALPYREGEVMLFEANIAPLKKLGWTCSTSLEEGLRSAIKGCLP